MADLKSFINTSSDRIKSAMGVPVDRIKTIQGSKLNLTIYANSITKYANSTTEIEVDGVTKTIKEFFDQLNTEFELLFNDQVFF